MKDYKNYKVGTEQERSAEQEIFESILLGSVFAILILSSLALYLIIEWV